MKYTFFLLIAALFLVLPSNAHFDCQHHHMIKNTTFKYLNDLSDSRLLQQSQSGRLRIYVDYTNVKTGGLAQINAVKRFMNISASFFYMALNVTRMPRLFFPKDINPTCNGLAIPDKYISDGVIGDLGIMCTNEQNPFQEYIAKATPCAFLASNNRAIWGFISFNNAHFNFNQQQFQQLIFIAMHEMTHVLGFSSIFYPLYPNKDLKLINKTNLFYLSSPRIQEQLKTQYNCTNFPGMPLEDQDGNQIGSHWEKKVIGNQYMIATNRKGAFVSRLTLALFQSTGFYTAVNYSMGEPMFWGKGKGCGFLDIDNCTGAEFCNDNGFACENDGTAIGQCKIDPFTGSCLIVKPFTNTICINQQFQATNLNAEQLALQRGGSNSRCFPSDFRSPDVDSSSGLDLRCYISVCSTRGNSIFLLVGSYVLVCLKENQVINAPPGLKGTLKCPSSFGAYCESKRTCPYHCNSNGACVNGKCLCTGNAFLTSSCIDISIFIAPIGTTGGFLFAKPDTTGTLSIQNLGNQGSNQSSLTPTTQQTKVYSINKKCLDGTALDRDFFICLPCPELYNCERCNEDGCIICDNGAAPRRGGICV